MAFENVAAQPEVVRLLRAALRSDRLPHALLFVGSKGIGRLAAADELARVYLCADRPSPDDYCGACESCRKMASGKHPDYRRAAVPEGGQLLPVNRVRDLQKAANLTPVLGTGRVFLIADADRMSLEAYNCFLKTLEEPPGNCLFILVASSLRDVPETVLSRCRLIRFRNLPPETVAEDLTEAGVGPEDARWLALRSWGSPGAAEGFRQRNLHQTNAELVDRLSHLSTRDNFELSDWLNAVAGSGTDSATEARIRLQELLECAALYYRDLALAAARRAASELLNQAAAAQIRQRAADAELDELLGCGRAVLDAVERIGANANRQLTLDNLFTELSRRLHSSV
ncbi:MAG: DNA polymerase III subunit [Candidatus Brocadiaceae bacterium]|jgi:DNA polymerase-3 subunit delta'